MNFFIISVLLFFGYSTSKVVDSTDTYMITLKSFQSPDSEYSSAPFFVWNGNMTKGEIENYLKDYKSKGVLQLFIHPRPGMITTYLTDEWFGLFTYTVELAKTMGMKVWIYDENSYPSGFAGGGVPASMPESKGKSLIFYKVTRPDSIQNSWAVYKKNRRQLC